MLTKNDPINPCYGCEKRTGECHASCDAYLGWKSKIDAAREERWQSVKNKKDCYDYTIKSVLRAVKRARR